MGSVTKTFKLSSYLAEASDIRGRNLKYRSFGSYLKGLIRYDLSVQGEHATTLPLSNARPEDQDKYDELMLELTKKGVGIRGEFFAGLLRDIISKKLETPEQIVEEMLRIATKAKKDAP